jgi:ABC-2 type transport system permease protein
MEKQSLAHGNPLTYEVDALRDLMLRTGHSLYGLWTDFAILLVFLLVMLVIGARLYPKLAR